MPSIARDPRAAALWLGRLVACFVALESVALQVLLRADAPRAALLASLADLALLGLGVHLLTRRHGGLRKLPLGLGDGVRALLLALLVYRGAARLAQLPDPGGISPWLLALLLELGIVALLVLSPSHGVTQLVPAPLAALLRSEWRIVSAACAWLARRPLRTPQGFGMLRTSGYPRFALAIVVLCVLEAPAMHLLGHAFASSHSLAMHLVIAAVHLYSFVWLAGDLRLLREARHQLSAEGLDVALGIRAAVFVPYGVITSVRHTDHTPKSALRITPYDTPNVLIELAESVPVAGLLGVRRSAQSLALFVDEPQAFVSALHAHLPAA